MPLRRELDRRRSARFRRIVREALTEVSDQIERWRIEGRIPDRLATRFHEEVESTGVVLQDEPDERQRDENERPDELLGLYEGVPATERVFGSSLLPPRITIFRRAIEAGWVSPARQREEIRKTILHEIGHALGLDEARLGELGLGDDEAHGP